jgi:hypothetical protein
MRLDGRPGHLTRPDDPLTTDTPRTLPRALATTGCPVGNCPGRVDSGRLMCSPCWHRVPPVMRARVWATWRAYLRGGSFEPYRLAARDAVDVLS